jgi:hypothetical protein
VANTTGFKARVEYEVTDGTQKTYTFPFSYLRKKFVMVSILHSDASETALEYGVEYTVNDLSVSLTTPAQVGEHLIIYRQTSTDKIVTWNDGSILLARDMNTEDAQMLHLQEEQQDFIQAHSINTKTNSDTKEVLWDALNHRVSNVSDPKDPQDAVTKAYMENVQGGFVAANTKILNDAKATLSATQQTQSKAQTNETLSKAWATATESPDSAEDAQSSTGKTQSSRSWALYSKEKAQEAATSEAHAKASETNAKASETKSLASEQNAKDSETNAKTSEIKAATSEVNAKTSETNAKSSETKSKDSENAARVSEQNAAESARVAVENAMDFNMLKRNKVYSIGDIAYSSYLPSWARLECVKAGTTAVTVPSSITTVSSGGVLISDGTVLWIVDDVRDMTPVGSVRGSLFLPKGYIKANGATVQRADYPRLVQFINSNNLWTDDTANNVGLFGKGDGSSTFVLPDYRERIPQYTEENIGAKRNAGLPNIIGGVRGLLLADRGEGTFKDAFIYGGIDNPNDGNADGTYGNGDLAGYTTSANGKLISFKFDAHTSNSIYGSSETVQPPAVNVFPILRYSTLQLLRHLGS